MQNYEYSDQTGKQSHYLIDTPKWDSFTLNILWCKVLFNERAVDYMLNSLFAAELVWLNSSFEDMLVHRTATVYQDFISSILNIPAHQLASLHTRRNFSITHLCQSNGRDFYTNGAQCRKKQTVWYEFNCWYVSIVPTKFSAACTSVRIHTWILICNLTQQVIEETIIKCLYEYNCL